MTILGSAPSAVDPRPAQAGRAGGVLHRAPVRPERASPPPAAPVGYGAVWALLVVNTLAFNGVSILGFPHAAGQVITMGALAGALLLVVVRNRRLLIRPSLFMTLVSVLALVAAASSARMEPGPGALLRAARYLVVVACLWLLTPLWRNPTALLRHHLRTSIGVLGLVAVGIVASGGRSLHGDQGRLVGAIWPMPPPQVAQFAAVLAGLAGTAWMTGMLTGRTAALTAVPALFLLLSTHTRTAMAGLVLGLALAAGSALLASRRAANFLVCVLAIAAVAATAAGGFVMHWLQRGESTQDLANLSGRQIVWGVLLTQPRSTADRFVGTGLSDKSFGGLSIDSTWLSVYWEQGLIGLALVAAIFAVLVLGVLSARPSPGRTVAVFLTGYLLMASWTEVGLGDADTYLLLAFLAAACMDHPWAPDGDPS